MIQNPKDTKGYTVKNVPPYSSPQPPSSSPWRQPIECADIPVGLSVSPLWDLGKENYHKSCCLLCAE